MNLMHRRESLLLFLGDIVILILSLILTLFIRYGSFPTVVAIETHLAPFSILFIAFILVNFIAGLYEKHTLTIKNRIPIILLNVQIANAAIGIAFFYLIPYFSISPKLFLFIYLVISLALMTIWRMFVAPKMDPRKSQKALLVGDTDEAVELYEEVNNNSRYHLSFVKMIRPSSNSIETLNEISEVIKKNNIAVVVLDTRHTSLIEVIPNLYRFAISGVLFFEIGKLYEEIFDRVPLSLVGQVWFVDNMTSVAPKFVYDSLKRIIDILVSLLWAVVSLVFYPFIILALKIEDSKNVIFTYQPRTGQNGKIINIIKFRTMTIANDNGIHGNVKNEVTKVGSFLRKSRLDELPQLWNIFVGDLSLVGPRPELPIYVDKYSKDISNYMIRHSVKPGIFGWAQIYHEKHPHHGIDVTETSNKLSYDLYYVKHRSLLLDIKIILRSVKVLLTFTGR